ncbi:hypothetical protein OJAV_G00234660 [Oryzias javanicus]|uniref:Ig-like domain-containing protein n=1 Tax=Oryzias javanicus TaxID=123683 RepID=A0A3S2LK42_ORYJA|nr:hypothetical protein OJAV_G00234660 [Oryzias javanicus]
MRLLTLFVSVLHVLHVEGQKKSQVTLVKVNKQVNTERHPQFQRRLELDSKSGDLTIKNLTLKDAMNYSVEIFYNAHPQTKKIELEVKQRLQAPTIQKIESAATQTGCFIALNCSSSEKDVNFSWKVSPPSLISWSTEKDSSYILVLTDSKQDLKFTCNSTKGKETAHQDYSAKCDVFTENLCHSRQSWGVIAAFGMFALVLSLLIYCYCQARQADEK